MSAHKVYFYPLGNADTTLIQLSSGHYILWDYANKKDYGNDGDKRCNLPEEIDKIVDDNFDIVCFTHADEDHIKGFSEYMYLEHAEKYQNEQRKKIIELWVPAAVLLDTTLEDEAKILKNEAKYRLKNKNGIKVFSRPKKMKEWCDQQDDISYEEVKHFIVDAGSLVPGFSKDQQGVEIFVHSPFLSESKSIDRNKEAIVVQIEFDDICNTKLILGSDIHYDGWQDIVEITKHKGNEDRLNWDLFHLSHHCSYRSLSDDKGENKTTPKDEIKWIFEDQGNNNSRIISPSWPIPEKGSVHDDDDPPHRQAANYYKYVIGNKKGEFIVTMKYPNVETPTPLIFNIDKTECAKLHIKETAAATFVYSSKAPRAGDE